MNTKKILIIGQALPAVKQKLPYDTTMLYEWLHEVNISKEDAQNIFEFDAVYGGEFLGYDDKGGHLKPSTAQKDHYWREVLNNKVNQADKLWILGRVADDYLKGLGAYEGKEVIVTIHPSRRNYSLYSKQKKQILNKITTLLNT